MEYALSLIHISGGGIDWDALPASVVAWVRVPGTTVDYPIVQGRPQSPDFSLTHDAGGERSAWGAPYIDAAVSYTHLDVYKRQA